MAQIAHLPDLDQAGLAATPRVSFRLYLWGVLSLVLTTLWFVKKNNWEIDTQTFWGIAIMILASRPALLWAKRNQSWFPAFEVAMLTCIPFYALPLLSHHRELRFYPESIITKASSIVILYIIISSLCFSIWKKTPRVSDLAKTSLVPPQAYRYIPLGILLSNIYSLISKYTNTIPVEASQIALPLTQGVGTLSIFISARLWGAKLLSPAEKGLLTFNIATQIILLFSNLYLISGISLFTLAIISYSMSRRSVPWVVILAFLPIISVLHLGKSQMRGQYWNENRTAQGQRLVEIHNLPLFFTEWISYGLQAGQAEKYTHIRQDTIFDRASLIHMLCLSVDRIPREKPYLKGETYLEIPATLIPRFLWKDKPSALIGTQKLGTYFELITPDMIYQVSIAFGMLAESYINFGHIGVIALGAILGLGLNRIAHYSRQAPQFSALGILSVLLTAWSLQVEQTAATWITSLLQAVILCVILPLGIHTFIKKVA